MSMFFYLFLLVLGLQATIHCAPHNSSEGKVTTCHLPQQNATLYKMPSINADFAFRLYRKLSVENPDLNIFFSPVSISAALAMLSFGSGSSTQTQILEVLGFNLTDTPVKELQQGFQHLICSLNFPNNELELQMGNAVFIGQQLKPLAKFLDDVKTLYETEVFSTDFSNVSAAQHEINSYVEKQTKGKIVGLIQDLKLNIIMILVNYIHFKAQWANPFRVSKTEESSNFSVDKSTTVQVPMMHQLEQYYHYVDVELNCTVLQMDYSANALALFVLPKEGHMEWVEAAIWVELFVPKFSISATYDLGSTLQKMGMRDAFAESADFPGITKDNGLKLSYAFHKAVLHIGEEGTKEGASPEAGSLDQPEVAPLHAVIRLDRTFLLMILEKRTRSVLFLGKVVDPTKE
ncbi:serine (or cysteine) peptidase inhibitor, clade A (alpha-1 antipeptidase, antitrypsin), member 7, isoform CRA_b [Rattus norvegicus]|uniref:Thyroxine-binding globulin n=1 Tax=Rattus norvegicus TaxID=10116 RepID=A6KNW7_RAT|nr:serine (or cysteine) peptidase inhibitor, clade A (alpha-1 antipeptidase, antitrypsin), member 7, isoform CRA_b [Rattus norvegicus]